MVKRIAALLALVSSFAFAAPPLGEKPKSVKLEKGEGGHGTPLLEVRLQLARGAFLRRTRRRQRRV